MGKPAARLTDLHTCPETSPSAHVGGPVITGAGTVLIEGKPAARVSDRLRCHGPTDVISTGSSTVIIEGRPAARVGDRTVHRGVIVSGASSVLIGD